MEFGQEIHTNARSTALNRVCSIFAQLLQFTPRMEFASAVAEHQAERHARGFSSWTQFVAMLFCQLGHAQSLREITQGLAASEGRLRHLGVGTLDVQRIIPIHYAADNRQVKMPELLTAIGKQGASNESIDQRSSRSGSAVRPCLRR
jgi:Domain of unknown function (DUF4372)